jgi:dephospho-CoA kinase
MIVGLTGGIATGKSTVSKLFQKYGVPVIDADQIAKDVVEIGKPTLALIAEHFGQGVLTSDGTLNRKKLGEVVFGDPTKRKELDAIIHPVILAEIDRRVEELESSNPDGLIIIDIPLLYETLRQNHFNEVILVYVPEDVQLARLMLRDGSTKDQALARMKAQMSIEDKRVLADYIIDNRGASLETERQVDLFLQNRGIRP